MNQIKKNWLISLLTIGFVIVVTLLNIYHNVNVLHSNVDSFCHISDFIDCDGVSKTEYAQAFGIPTAGWGLMFYTFVLFLIYTPNLAKINELSFLKVFKNPLSYIYSLGLISLCVSIFLAIVQFVQIEKICILCFGTYIIDLGLIIVSKTEGENIFYDVIVSIKDFIEAIKIKKYLIAFICVMLTFILCLYYATVSYAFTPHLKRQHVFNKFQAMKASDFPVYGNELPNSENATVQVTVFSDYECPFCATYNTILNKVFTKDIKNVKVQHKNFPLDGDCNTYVSGSVHKNACLMARYAIAAEKQGQHWDMNSLLFDEKPQNEQEILSMSRNLNLDVDKLKKDANSDEVKTRLTNEIQEAVTFKITGTPCIVVNGKTYQGLKLDYDLIKILLDNGAQRK